MSRYLKFTSADKNGRRFWKLVYYFFLDSSCKILSYKIAAEGTYSKPKKSHTISGSFEVAFNLTDTEITPYEMLIVGSLQAEPKATCGVSSKWRAGETQSVKATNGCRLFGISIPSVEYDILKTVRSDNGDFDLYTGQSSTDNVLHDTPAKRPTSFQLPLRRCRDVVKTVRTIPTTQAAETRQILIYRPDFTLPKRYFVQTEKSDNTVQEQAVHDNAGHSASQRLAISVIAPSLLLASVLCQFVL